MYVSALRGMIKTKQVEAQNMTEFSFKPCDLVDFMIERAKVEPLAFCILLELRFAEVAFLLHQ